MHGLVFTTLALLNFVSGHILKLHMPANIVHHFSEAEALRNGQAALKNKVKTNITTEKLVYFKHKTHKTADNNTDIQSANRNNEINRQKVFKLKKTPSRSLMRDQKTNNPVLDKLRRKSNGDQPKTFWFTLDNSDRGIDADEIEDSKLEFDDPYSEGSIKGKSKLQAIILPKKGSSDAAKRRSVLDSDPNVLANDARIALDGELSGSVDSSTRYLSNSSSLMNDKDLNTREYTPSYGNIVNEEEVGDVRDSQGKPEMLLNSSGATSYKSISSEAQQQGYNGDEEDVGQVYAKDSHAVHDGEELDEDEISDNEFIDPSTGEKVQNPNAEEKEYFKELESEKKTKKPQVKIDDSDYFDTSNGDMLDVEPFISTKVTEGSKGNDGRDSKHAAEDRGDSKHAAEDRGDSKHAAEDKGDSKHAFDTIGNAESFNSAEFSGAGTNTAAFESMDTKEELSKETSSGEFVKQAANSIDNTEYIDTTSGAKVGSEPKDLESVKTKEEGEKKKKEEENIAKSGEAMKQAVDSINSTEYINTTTGANVSSKPASLESLKKKKEGDKKKKEEENKAKSGESMKQAVDSINSTEYINTTTGANVGSKPKDLESMKKQKEGEKKKKEEENKAKSGEALKQAVDSINNTEYINTTTGANVGSKPKDLESVKAKEVGDKKKPGEFAKPADEPVNKNKKGDKEKSVKDKAQAEDINGTTEYMDTTSNSSAGSTMKNFDNTENVDTSNDAGVEPTPELMLAKESNGQTGKKTEISLDDAEYFDTSNGARMGMKPTAPTILSMKNNEDTEKSIEDATNGFMSAIEKEEDNNAEGKEDTNISNKVQNSASEEGESRDNEKSGDSGSEFDGTSDIEDQWAPKPTEPVTLDSFNNQFNSDDLMESANKASSEENDTQRKSTTSEFLMKSAEKIIKAKNKVWAASEEHEDRLDSFINNKTVTTSTGKNGSNENDEFTINAGERPSDLGKDKGNKDNHDSNGSKSNARGNATGDAAGNSTLNATFNANSTSNSTQTKNADAEIQPENRPNVNDETSSIKNSDHEKDALKIPTEGSSFGKADATTPSKTTDDEFTSDIEAVARVAIKGDKDEVAGEREATGVKFDEEKSKELKSDIEASKLVRVNGSELVVSGDQVNTTAPGIHKVYDDLETEFDHGNKTVDNQSTTKNNTATAGNDIATPMSPNNTSVNNTSVKKQTPNQPSIKKQSANQQSIPTQSMNQPSANNQSLDQSSVNKQSVNQPSVEKQSPNQPSIKKQSPNQPSANNKSLNQSSINKPSVKNQTPNQPSVNKQSPNQPSIKKQSPNQPSVNKQSLNKSLINSTSINKPSLDHQSLDNTFINGKSLNNTSIGNKSLNHKSLQDAGLHSLNQKINQNNAGKQLSSNEGALSKTNVDHSEEGKQQQTNDRPLANHEFVDSSISPEQDQKISEEPSSYESIIQDKIAVAKQLYSGFDSNVGPPLSPGNKRINQDAISAAVSESQDIAGGVSSNPVPDSTKSSLDGDEFKQYAGMNMQSDDIASRLQYAMELEKLLGNSRNSTDNEFVDRPVQMY